MEFKPKPYNESNMAAATIPGKDFAEENANLSKYYLVNWSVSVDVLLTVWFLSLNYEAYLNLHQTSLQSFTKKPWELEKKTAPCTLSK